MLNLWLDRQHSPEQVPGCLRSIVFVSRLEVGVELIGFKDTRKCLFVTFAKCAPKDVAIAMRNEKSRNSKVDLRIGSYDIFCAQSKFEGALLTTKTAKLYNWFKVIKIV